MPATTGTELRGEYPAARIFKAYSELDHALSLVERGNFRMGSLRSYREIEDAERRDIREGYGYIQAPGTITVGHFAPGNPDFFETSEEQGLQQHRMEMGNPIYIFSTSIEGVDLSFVRDRWPYIVCIEDPQQFGLETSEFFKRQIGFKSGVEGRIVRYDHGEVVEDRMDSWERMALSYYQKPASFSREHEFRLVAIDTGNTTQRIHHDFIEVDLGGPIEYASLL